MTIEKLKHFAAVGRMSRRDFIRNAVAAGLTVAAAEQLFVKVAKAEPKNAGKSDEILLKAGEGRLQKEFVNQAVLLKQVFVIDGKATVAEILKQAEKDVGAPVKISGFVRYQLGEGIEKKTEDFAAEVAKTVGAAQKS